MSNEAVLCYVRDQWAFFTTQPLSDQWGDDWNDAPYEHNAGDPYSWLVSSGKPEYEIIRVAYIAHMETPAELANGNSHYSVEDINRGDVAWLRPYSNNSRGKPIFAGVTVEEFKRAIWQIRGDVYVAAEKPSGDVPW